MSVKRGRHLYVTSAVPVMPDMYLILAPLKVSDKELCCSSGLSLGSDRCWFPVWFQACDVVSLCLQAGPSTM